MGLVLKSSAFDDGAEIPRKHGYKNGNSSPPLEIEGVPEACRSLALIMDDPDAQAAVGKTWVHWLVWHMPSDMHSIPESLVSGGCTEGRNDFGEAAYGGPAPPDKRHTYFFRLYALDFDLSLSAGCDRKDLEDAMKGHILEETVLTGTYAP
ncbi:phospholipid-binding protein [Cenarchaeum symbiosum A]|uniref:Phospholipid-binding protein n=1 Tax=Cenarchaeum symbiosum (strain A) TaxID=414004 RepID=A0RYX8_CENSY|nr:phospholipid-binding protein [Cenarchaeum symbiosum A]